jgi:hypothetical protein
MIVNFILLMASIVGFYWFNISAGNNDTLVVYIKQYGMLVNGAF